MPWNESTKMVKSSNLYLVTSMARRLLPCARSSESLGLLAIRSLIVIKTVV